MVMICPSKCLMEKIGLQGMWSSLIFVTCICRECGCLSTGTVYWWKAELTKKSFVMICLLPQCDSSHVPSLLGQVQDVNRFNYDHRVDRNHSPCTQNAFSFFPGKLLS